ncbi:MAG TPA: alanine racemase [Ktedonobacteraceae bacterium]|nr:alanine racemase [Ktedonobacteraceae bacterium]
MYLQRLIERNPRLMEAAITLHQEGHIPPNTWLIDLDTIAENARALSAVARSLGLTTYLMSKQYGRNPYVSALALANGLHKIVAVDATCALMAHRYGLPVGHMGHLNQLPRHMVPLLVAMRPEVITIYNIEHARWIDSAAADLGIVQELLIRVSAPGDIFFDGQEGGFSENEVPAIVDALSHLRHVRLVGVTAFPCVRYNHRADEKAEVTPNLHTILRAAATLRGMGVEVKQINAPGNTSTMTMPLVAPPGATHVEPGHALTGTTPNHAFYGDALPERPAYVYVSEISHHVGERAYAYGGGLFHDGYQADGSVGALVGSTWEEARDNGVEYLHDIKQIIDYHVVLQPGQRCKVGDTALLFYRTQMQMTRSYIALVSGLSGRSERKVHYLFDHASTALDSGFNPVDPASVRQDIDALLNTQYQ